MSTLPAVVLDNGTGYTKIGYAGNVEPSYLIPSLIAVDSKADLSKCPKNTEDFDFFIGAEAENAPKAYTKSFPLKHGLIENWTLMEMYWEQAIFKYLRCDPEDHYFLLTEPPLNPPENREYLAEVFFESFNVPGMYIAVQAVLAIVASWSGKDKKDQKKENMALTGTVIDSGDGVTHVIPVADGYVIGSSIKHIPLAGRDITSFIQQLLVERNEPIPAEERMEMARTIKEKYAFVSKDITQEFGIMDSGKDEKGISTFKKHEAIDPISKKKYSFDVGYEQFLAPELFFNPEIFSSEFTQPLAAIVDDVIQSCPIDCRRNLYSNIVLSGGSTMFNGFGQRLQRDVKRFTDFRYNKAVELAAGRVQPQKTDVKVVKYNYQRYAVWYGGSVMAGLPTFIQYCHSKAEYEEKGPAVCRYNHVFMGC